MFNILLVRIITRYVMSCFLWSWTFMPCVVYVFIFIITKMQYQWYEYCTQWEYFIIFFLFIIFQQMKDTTRSKVEFIHAVSYRVIRYLIIWHNMIKLMETFGSADRGKYFTRQDTSQLVWTRLYDYYKVILIKPIHMMDRINSIIKTYFLE